MFVTDPATGEQLIVPEGKYVVVLEFDELEDAIKVHDHAHRLISERRKKNAVCPGQQSFEGLSAQ